jgi:hypothetical protein
MWRGTIFWIFMVLKCAVLATNYCATFKSIEAAGATGYFALSVDQGSANYYYDLDLSKYSTKCDLSKGLLFRIHNNWKAPKNNSASGATSCGSASVGYHYDPNYACSAAASPKWCGALNRTSARGYKYSCQPNLPVSQCEIGDLSGKFGVATPTLLYTGTSAKYPTIPVFSQPQSSPLVDYQPPYAADFRKMSAFTKQMWSSVVFHCAVDKTPLVCARFSLIAPTQGSTCNFPVAGQQQLYSSDSAATQPLDNEGIAAAVISAFFFAYVLGTVIYFCRQRFGPRSRPGAGSTGPRFRSRRASTNRSTDAEETDEGNGFVRRGRI